MIPLFHYLHHQKSSCVKTCMLSHSHSKTSMSVCIQICIIPPSSPPEELFCDDSFEVPMLGHDSQKLDHTNIYHTNIHHPSVLLASPPALLLCDTHTIFIILLSCCLRHQHCSCARTIHSSHHPCLATAQSHSMSVCCAGSCQDSTWGAHARLRAP